MVSTRLVQRRASNPEELSLEAIEDRRQLEHVVPLFVAFLLPYITYRGVLVLGGLGLIYALYISPRWIQVTTRPEERNRVSTAKLSYALASLSVLLFFHGRIYIGAGALAILAVGDALSNFVGRKVGGPRFPYNRKKTLAGTIAFWLGGTISAWTVLLWNRPPGGEHSPIVLLAYAALVAGACALFETLPAVLDDNITIVWLAALLFWLLFSLEPFPSKLALISWGDSVFRRKPTGGIRLHSSGGEEYPRPSKRSRSGSMAYGAD